METSKQQWERRRGRIEYLLGYMPNGMIFCYMTDYDVAKMFRTVRNKQRKLKRRKDMGDTCQTHKQLKRGTRK